MVTIRRGGVLAVRLPPIRIIRFRLSATPGTEPGQGKVCPLTLSFLVLCRICLHPLPLLYLWS